MWQYNKTMQKMINFDDVIKEETKWHNPNWPQIPDDPYRILITGGSRSGKKNSLFNLINQQPDIDKVYLYAKDPYEAKYQIYIKKREDVGTKHFDDIKAFIEYSNDIVAIDKNIEECNRNKKHKILIAFDDMIPNMLYSKKLDPIGTELFIRGKKLNISLVFISKSYLAMPKNIRLISMRYFIMKILNKRELQYILYLIIHQILTLETLWIFTKNYWGYSCIR